MNSKQETMQIEVPTSGKTALVHKKDHEGVIMIDPMTGLIATPLDERPDWAEGLVTAQTGERHIFYNARLGDKYTAELKEPEALAFEDLAWLTMVEHPEDAPYINPETGAEEPFHLELVDADYEHRAEVINNVYGFTVTSATDLNPEMMDFGATEATVDIAYPDQERSEEEALAFENSQRDQLKAVNE